MGITRATGVRCPWCARPVGDGPDRPSICPSCGVPLAPAAPAAGHPVTFEFPAARIRRTQRLRATAALLALTAVVLGLAAVPLGVAALSSDHGDGQAQTNLIAVLRAAESIKRGTSQFAGAHPDVLTAQVYGIKVLDSLVPSTGPTEVSGVVAGDGWYGAVRSRSGRCFAAATVGGNPVTLQTVLAGNCTGDASRAALTPLAPGPDPSISPAQPDGTPSP
jgi:hypothetical protein